MQFVLGAAIGLGIYAIHKRTQKRSDIYPAWTGSMTNDRGQAYPINWTDFKIIDGEKIRATGVDLSGEYSCKGKIRKDGSVTFEYRGNNGKTRIQFAGNVVGPNKIAGTWVKGTERGNFEILAEAKIYQVERLVTNNPMVYHNYPIAFTEKRQYIVGLGRDSFGFYRCEGRMDVKNNTLRLEVYYANGTFFVFTTKKKEIETVYQGHWVGSKQVTSGGVCSIKATPLLVNQKNQLGNPLPRAPEFGQENQALINHFPQQPYNFNQMPQQPQPVVFPGHQMFEHAKTPVQPQHNQGYPNPHAYQPYQPGGFQGQPLQGQPPARPFSSTPFDY